MVVSAGCPHAHPAAATSSTTDFLIPNIDSPPVARKSRDRKPPGAADETAMCLILSATNHVDAEVRAQHSEDTLRPAPQSSRGFLEKRKRRRKDLNGLVVCRE